MSNKKEVLIWLNNLLFIGLFFGLAYFNRPAHDDYFSMFTVNERGLIDSVIHQYNNWCSRYFATFFSFLVTAIPSFLARNLVMSLTLFVIYSISFYQIISLFSSLKSYSVSLKVGLSIFFFSGLFYGTIAIGETWFWLSANSTYTLALGFVLLSIPMIFSIKSNKLHYLGIVLFFALVGGMHEMLALSLVLILVLLLLFQQRLKLHRVVVFKIVLGLIAMSITLFILIKAPGNQKREGFFESISVVESLVLNASLLNILVRSYLLSTLPVIVLWALTLGAVLPKIHASFLGFRKFVFIYLPIMIGLIYFYHLPVAYKTQDIAALRTLLPISLVLVVFFFCFFAGSLYKTKLLHKLAPISLLSITLLFQSYHFFNQFNIASNYANAVDKRIEEVKSASCENELIQLSPLPNSGWLYSSELKEDPSHYLNEHFVNGLQLNCAVKVVYD